MPNPKRNFLVGFFVARLWHRHQLIGKYLEWIDPDFFWVSSGDLQIFILLKPEFMSSGSIWTRVAIILVVTISPLVASRLFSMYVALTLRWATASWWCFATHAWKLYANQDALLSWPILGVTIQTSKVIFETTTTHMCQGQKSLPGKWSSHLQKGIVMGFTNLP